METKIRKQGNSCKVGEKSPHPKRFFHYKQKPIMADLNKEIIYGRTNEVIH